MKAHIHVWHLELTDPALVPRERPRRAYELNRLPNPAPEFARFLYVTVGATWNWYMRLQWSYAEWQARVDNPAVEFWLATQGGHPIGYFELERRPGKDVEICFFGLLPAFIGHGFGKQLLEDAIYEGWQFGGKRVWLHTCTLDHPSALSNYKARGFTVFKEEDVTDELPEKIEPWPGSGSE